MIEHGIRRDVRVPMRDGVELATDVYLPATDGPFPTLLQRTPYDRSDPFGAQYIAQVNILRALDAGFAVVVQDTRGRYGSGGDFYPFVHEGDDGADTVAWICAQEFSDGNVATYGASYVGATQMLMAMQGTSGHVAMAPFLTTGDYHGFWTYRHGALQLGFVLLWIIEALAPPDVVHRRLPLDDAAHRALAALRADPVRAMSWLPILSDDLVVLAPYLSEWLENATPDRSWPDISPIRHAERIRTPALHIAGFNDIFLEGSLAAYDALRRDGVTEAVRDGQYLVIGPWSHGNLGDWQGRRWYGYGAAAPDKDLTGMQLEFFSAVIAGREPRLPRVQYFTSGSDEWRCADEWPPPSTDTSLYLGDAGTLTRAPEGDGEDRYISDTLDPVPTRGGATFLPGVLTNVNDGPHDQADVEARDDVLVYRSAPLAQPIEVTGLVRLELWAASSATDCDWTARLVDVDAGGLALGIVDGVVRSRYRHGSEPTPLTPGEPEMFVVELGHISHVFTAGHRIGLQIASSNFPRFDRNPQQMVDPVRAAFDDFVRAEQTVLWGNERQSRVRLPVVSGGL